MARWRYALYDLLTGAPLADHMPFKIDSFTKMLNEPGTLQATLSLGSPEMRLRQPKEVITPKRTNLILLRDEVPVWDGIIWTRRRHRSGGENSLAITASETRSYFDRRTFRPELGYGSAKTLAFTDVDQFTAIRTVMTDCLTIAVGALQPGNIGVEMDASLSGVLISRIDAGSETAAFHGYYWATYGALFDDLAKTAPGMEWRLDPYLDESRELKRRLLLGSPQLGTLATSANIASFEFPGQIIEYEWPDDGEGSANYVAALGAGDGNALKWAEAYNNVELDAGYPLMEATVAHKADSNIALLGSRAAVGLAQMSGTLTVPTISMVGYPEVSLGDHIKARIKDEDWWPGSSLDPFEAIVRVVGMRVTPGEKERTALIIEEPRSAA